MKLRKRTYALLGGSLVLAVVLAVAATRANRPDAVTLPAGTSIHVVLNQALSSGQNRPGDHFEASISEPVVVGDKTVVPQGADVQGLVVDAHRSGRLMGRARLELALETVAVNGMDYEVRTTAPTKVGRNHKKRNILFIGGGAGAGTLIGAIAGGGEGALIGGPVGAGAGTAVAFLTGERNIHLPAESHLTFRLVEPVTIHAKG